jgi:hypothetical protein
LTFTFERTLPAIHQRAQFIIPPDEGGQDAGRSRSIETPARSTRLNYAVNIYRPFDAFESLRAAIFDDEQARDQPMSGVCDRDGPGFRCGLHPRREIGHVAEDFRFVAGALTNHGRARIDTDPGGQLRMSRLLIKFRDRVEDREAPARSALRIVVVRRGPPEIGHDAVAEVLSDVTVEALDRLPDGPMVVGDNLPPFLGIGPRWCRPNSRWIPFSWLRCPSSE